MVAQKNQKKKSQPKFSLKLENLLGLDLRSLALFRVALAFLILTDLSQRLPNLRTHYSDFGLLPREPVVSHFSESWFWSIHLGNGLPWFEGLLLLFAALAALALLVGYRTQLATLVSWLLMISLHNRNGLILTSGDIEFQLLLFWSIFLPLGAYYSVDRALNSSSKPVPKQIFSFATVALTLQICFIYWFNWALKSSPSWRQDGSALHYIFNLDFMTTSAAQWLLQFPGLLVVLTFFWLWIELIVPFFLFIPIYHDFFRISTVTIFILLHLSLGLTLTLGLSSLIGAAAWLVFLPSSIWDRLTQKLETMERLAVNFYYDGESSTCKRIVSLVQVFLILPTTSLIPAQENPEILTFMSTFNSWVVVEPQGQKSFKFKALVQLCRYSPIFRFLVPLFALAPIVGIGNKLYTNIASNRRTVAKIGAYLPFWPLKLRPSLLGNFFVLISLSCVLLWNLNSVSPGTFTVPQGVTQLSYALGLNQKWDLFAPSPSTQNGWYVILGKFKDGTQRDLMTQSPNLAGEKPALMSAIYPNVYWLRYLEQIAKKENAHYLPYYGKYLCRTWNDNPAHQGSKQLESLEIILMSEKILPQAQPSKVEKQSLWKQSCL